MNNQALDPLEEAVIESVAHEKPYTPRTFTTKQKMMFIIPSLIGAAFFLFPTPYKGEITIPMAIIAGWLSSLVKPWVSTIILTAVAISAIGGWLTKIFKPRFVLQNALLNKLFNDSTIYLILKACGLVFTLMIYFKIGPDFLIGADTGGTMLGMMGTPVTWILVAALFIPLLTDFGIMDYVGTLLRNAIYPLFRLPGRAAIDLLASWVGNSNVGVVLTIGLYEKGTYTAREAITIATCFSTVSLPYTALVCQWLSIERYFLPFYATMVVCGVVSTFIMVRIPPLSRYANEYYAPVGKQVDEYVPTGVSLRKWATEKAVERAESFRGAKSYAHQSATTYLNILINLVPVTMFIGVLALAVAEYTPVFQYISVPFHYLFEFMGIPEAAKAAPAAIVGFIDMYLPIIIGMSLESPFASFIAGVLALVQIIYITEVGMMLIRSKVPVGFWGLLGIFMVKTLIILPLSVLCAMLFGIPK